MGEKGEKLKPPNVSHISRGTSAAENSQGQTQDLFLKETQRGKNTFGMKDVTRPLVCLALAFFMYCPNLKKSYSKQCDKAIAFASWGCPEKNKEIRATMWKKSSISNKEKREQMD